MVTLDKITALCKRRAFVYPSSEIYGGLNGVYDFGPLGYAMKENIRAFWKRSVQQQDHGEVVLMEGALLGKSEVWQASGHVAGFHDPLVDCTACKRRFRADELDLANDPCPVCGTRGAWTAVRQFNLMFKTTVGAVEDPSAIAYLRPETAQAIFVNFKNVTSSYRVKIPFGIGQIGTSFRNEITPKQFLFRTREFEQMELEWFCRPEAAAGDFEFWLERRTQFYRDLGLFDAIRMREHEKHELAHYAASCTDVEFEFPFGWKELEGIANRGNFDLSQHSRESKKDLAVFDEETKQSYVPHVIESSVGTNRLMLALLCHAYHEEAVEGEEQRIVLRLHPAIAPMTAAFMPLVKKLSEPVEKLYKELWAKGYRVQFDEAGSIGKRYRRQDEIGTPLCFTYDFDSQTDNCVTVRHRDSMRQERVSLDAVEKIVQQTLAAQ